MGGEIIVVAKLNFFNRHRVILVDNGHDPGFDQGQKGMLGVQIAAAVGQIVMGEKNLRHPDGMPRKAFFIQRHERNLSNGCGRLFRRYRPRALFHIECTHSRSNGSRSH